MNDFTKEELEWIYESLSHMCGKWNREIMTKVQSMVDNYCEHSFAFYISPDGNAVRCPLCNKVIS